MKLKNCVFDQHCPFLKIGYCKDFQCKHPSRPSADSDSIGTYSLPELFKGCPLKKEKFVVELEGENNAKRK